MYKIKEIKIKAGKYTCRDRDLQSMVDARRLGPTETGELGRGN